MARMPLWPMPSSATIRSLLVTPSSFARSMTLTRAATARLPPRPRLARIAAALLRGRLAGRLNACPSRPACSALLQALGRRRTRTRRAPPPRPSRSTCTTPPSLPHQPDQLRLRPHLPTADAGALRRRCHSASELLDSGVGSIVRSAVPRPRRALRLGALGRRLGGCSATHAWAAAQDRARLRLADARAAACRASQPGLARCAPASRARAPRDARPAAGRRRASPRQAPRGPPPAPPRRGAAPPRPRPRS